MKLVAVQMSISDGRPDENLVRAGELLDGAGLSGGDLVCLPELLNTGYDWETIGRLTEEDKAKTLEALAGHARKHGIFLVAGSIAEAVGGLRYNASYVFSPSGGILGRYAKTHLFSPIDEDRHFMPGDASLVVEACGTRVGVAICYDLRFPELFRRLVLDGARIVAMPAVWPNERAGAWRALSIARAMEEQIALIAVNRGGVDSEGREFGGSIIVDPWGNVLAEAVGGEETIIEAEFDLGEVEKARSSIPSLVERRPEVYRLDWEISEEIMADEKCGFGDAKLWE